MHASKCVFGLCPRPQHTHPSLGWRCGVWMEEEEEEEEEDLVGYRRFRIPSCPVRLDDSSTAAALCGVAAVESAALLNTNE